MKRSTSETDRVLPRTGNPASRWSAGIRRTILAMVAAAAAIGGLAVTAAPAEASVTHCGNGQCTVYLSKSETQAVARGQVPGANSLPPGPLRMSYYALVYGHRFFAGQYANRGWCSAFSLDVRPWARQGYWGYACKWA